MKYFYTMLAFLFLQATGLGHGFGNPAMETEDCATLKLVSGAATENQTLCINNPIANIIYVAGNGATDVVITGNLPDGITSNYIAATQTMTFSGTAAVAGTFDFQVTTVGGECPSFRNVTILVQPNAGLIASLNTTYYQHQTVCVNSVMPHIQFLLRTGATAAIATGLPPGIGMVQSGNGLTISGTPTVVGTYNYTVTTSGGCGTASRSGIIEVVSDAPLDLISSPELLNQTICQYSAMEPVIFNAQINANVQLTNSNYPFNVGYDFLVRNYKISSQSWNEVGVYYYEVSVLGGNCGNPSFTGTVTVKPFPFGMTLGCDFPSDAPDTIINYWAALPGATGYFYRYHVGEDGPEISGTTTNTQVVTSGLLPSQTVHFSYKPLGDFCDRWFTQHCTIAPLAVDAIEKDGLFYSPNPVRDVLNLESGTTISGLSVFNLLGQQVLDHRCHERSLQLNLGALGKGMYLIKVETKSAVKNLRILKE